MNFDELKKLISNLRSDLSKYRTEEVFGYAFLEMTRIDWANPGKMNLHSPFRQCCYIASLAMSVKQVEKPIPLDEGEWKAICQKTNEIYNYYALMHFPADGDFSKITEEKHKKGKISMPSFLHSFCTGVSASVEQVREDILSLYSPFTKEIETSIGINVQDIIEICVFIEDTLKERITNGPVKAYKCWLEFRRELDKGIDFEIAITNARKCVSDDVASSIMRMGIITFSEIKNKFSQEKATAFINLVSQKRKNNLEIQDTSELIFPTEELSVSLKPLANLDNNEFTLITSNHLIFAIQENLYQCIEHLGILEKYNRKKGDFLEKNSLCLLKNIFGETAQYYTEVYETSKDQNEHDIIILYKRCLIIIECKAKRIRKDFRDIEKSFVRIQHGFKSYIQEGYDQSRKLEKLIISQQETILYKKGGDIALKINRRDFDKIEKIVLTHENEGILATKLSLLLQLDHGDVFPICLNINDLKQLSQYKQHIQLTGEKFITYLSQRKLLHHKIANDDELDIFGFFLNKGSLEEIINSKCDIYYIEPGFSKIFDEAYRNKQFPIKTLKKKIGRNEQCPCGSGIKHKKCCLKVAS